MRERVSLHEAFGPFCANGQAATRYLRESILPLILRDCEITFDLQGIKNMNSSFSNALFANLVMQQGIGVIQRINFLHCKPSIQVLISAALERGIRKTSHHELRTGE